MGIIITNARLLDCVGESAVEDVSITIEDQEIKEIYQEKRPILPQMQVIDAQGRTVMPGLIDAHSHFAITNNDMGATYLDPPLYTALKMREQLERILQGGFTTLRDGGGGHFSLKNAVKDGLIVGPRLLISGALLSSTGGHGDFNVKGQRIYHEDLPFFNLMRLCDGEDECRKAVREQFRQGATQIKITVSGGCASPNDQAWHIQFSEGEIETIVEEAEARGTYVMAHCHSDEAVRRAVKCGVKSIEHGSFMSLETAQLMKEKGASLISTMAVVEWALNKGKKEGAAEWFIEKLANPNCSPDGASLMEGIIRSFRNALEVGVPVGSGADFFGTMCGQEAKNIEHFAKLTTPYDAIKAATIVNARILQREDQIGSIIASKLADIIIVEGNPDQDIELLLDPGKIKLVIKEGDILKNNL